MLFRIELMNRHDGSVIVKRVEAPSEKLAIKWALSNVRRCDFKFNHSIMKVQSNYV